MMPLFIFDLDGTIALTQHRGHFLEKRPKDWDGFTAACAHDPVCAPVIKTLQMLSKNGEIWIWSGRMMTVAAITMRWLREAGVMWHVSQLKMRPTGDHRDDAVLKKQWLDEMSAADRERLVAIFDDRNKVVAMWRAAGVTCFQVALGDF